MNSFKNINLGVSFILELAMLVAFSVWGFSIFHGAPGWAVGLGVPAVLIVFWSIWMAPKSDRRLPWPWRPIVSLLLFLLASIALIASGHQTTGGFMAGVTVVNAFFVFLWHQ